MVIAAAGEDRRLGAGIRTDGFDFEDRMRVVVQASYQAVVNFIRNAKRIQRSKHFLEVLSRGFVEIVAEPRSTFENRAFGIHLAVENSQRILFQAAVAIAAELIDMRRKVFLQSSPVGSS